MANMDSETVRGRGRPPYGAYDFRNFIGKLNLIREHKGGGPFVLESLAASLARPQQDCGGLTTNAKEILWKLQGKSPVVQGLHIRLGRLLNVANLGVDEEWRALFSTKRKDAEDDTRNGWQPNEEQNFLTAYAAAITKPLISPLLGLETFQQLVAICDRPFQWPATDTLTLSLSSPQARKPAFELMIQNEIVPGEADEHPIPANVFKRGSEFLLDVHQAKPQPLDIFLFGSLTLFKSGIATGSAVTLLNALVSTVESSLYVKNPVRGSITVSGPFSNKLPVNDLSEQRAVIVVVIPSDASSPETHENDPVATLNEMITKAWQCRATSPRVAQALIHVPNDLQTAILRTVRSTERAALHLLPYRLV